MQFRQIGVCPGTSVGEFIFRLSHMRICTTKNPRYDRKKVNQEKSDHKEIVDTSRGTQERLQIRTKT